MTRREVLGEDVVRENLGREVNEGWEKIEMRPEEQGDGKRAVREKIMTEEEMRGEAVRNRKEMGESCSEREEK